MRIWITAARHVRTQCEKNEGKAVELKHIGLFFKRKNENKYGYVPNSELLEDGRLHIADINHENYPTLPAEVRSINKFILMYRLQKIVMEKLFLLTCTLYHQFVNAKQIWSSLS
jgi:hypothetical protein